ncbi:MAG: TetR family transcriptional regulator [Rhodothalassiaceae bacterium]
MAGKGSATAKSRNDIRDRIIDTALRLIAERKWAETKVADVIREAGVSEADFYAEFDGLLSVVIAASRRVNAAMMDAKAEFDPDDSPRDKLFALIMARFDAAEPWRKAIGELNRAAPRDPVLAAAAGQMLTQTAALALEAAGIDTRGPLGFARTNAFMVGVLWPAARAWIRDDTPDRSKTMAELDRCLARAEMLANWFGPLAGTNGEATPEAVAKDEPGCRSDGTTSPAGGTS